MHAVIFRSANRTIAIYIRESRVTGASVASRGVGTSGVSTAFVGSHTLIDVSADKPTAHPAAVTVTLYARIGRSAGSMSVAHL